MKEEIWKPVVGYEEFYDVSSFGRVRSWATKGSGLKRMEQPRYMTACRGTKGYPQVSIGVRYKKKTHRVHRLVSDAFLRKLHPGESVNHINNIKTDNRVENLEIMSASENCSKAWKDGLMQPTADHNRDHPRPKKLTLEQVREIRAAPAQYGLYKILGEIYGVHRMTIGEIRRGEIWKKDLRDANQLQTERG